MADPFDKYLKPKAESKSEADPFAPYIDSSPEQSDPFAQYLGPQPASVQKEISERSFWDRPAGGSEYTSKTEIQDIAKRYGVDSAELESLAPYFGARIEGSSFISTPELKRTAGELGSSIGLSIPQKLYKKYRGGPMEAALDELQQLAEGRKGFTTLVGEVAIPGLGVGTKAATTAGKIAGGVATGAAAGYGGSSREHELEGTMFGAGVGGAVSGLAARLGQRAANKTEAETTQAVLRREGANLDAGTEALLKQRSASEEDIQKIFRAEAELDEHASNRIVREQLDADFVQRAMDPGTEEGRIIREAVSRESPELVSREGFEKAIERKLATDVVDHRLRDFAEELTEVRPKSLAEAREAIQEYASRQGAQATNQRYSLFNEERAALDYIKQQAVRVGRGDNFQDRALNMLSDAQFVLRDIDERVGTSLEPVHRRMNAAYNRLSFARNDARKQLDDIFKANKAIDSELTNGDKIYQALDTGNLADLSPAEQKAASQFKQFFDRSLEYVNNVVRSRDPDIAPLSIPKRENYVPHMLASTEDLLSRVTERVDELKRLAVQLTGREVEDLAQLTPQQFRQLSSSRPMQDLITGLKVFDAKPINSAAELSARLKDTFDSRGGRIKLETVARAALERQGQIPHWMRETNLYKLADRWSTNTLKHLYLRRDMDAMRSIANRLDKAGADLEANYVRNLLSDLNGIRKGTMAERTRQGEIQYQQWVDRLADRASSPVARGAVAVAKAIPTILADLNKQVYPNLLGMSPKAILMQATQTLAKTAPELGTQYGYTTLLRGAVHAALNSESIAQRLEREGFVPAEFISKYRQAVAEGIRRNSLYAIPSEVLNSMGNAAMWLYTKMDSVNRAITLGTADMMAHDLVRGSKMAQQSLAKKFPPSVQKQVARAGSNEQEVAAILSSHLNASTQYNYNRASMSEYGRSMGPLFSTFSKWPTATLGEMVQEYRQRGLLKGTLRNAEKYAAPLLLFQAADYLIYGNDPDQMSDRQKKLLGAGGLSQASPIGSVEGIVKGDFFTPPAIDAIIQTMVVPTLDGDESKLRKGLASAIQNFTPGSVYVRFLTDDLPTLITGDRPAGSDFLERTAEAMK